LLPVDDGKLRLTIEDDGMGVEQQSQEGSGQGIGSRLIHAFAQQVGGTTNVTTREGGGTIVTLTFADPMFEARAA
jgi:nitrate/nitrite-specific signal transduction histidine kinase